MKLLVCVKQVPDTTEIKIDPVTNTLIRDGVPSILNPYDGFALETAVRLKEATGGEVTVVCMGPTQASAVLKESLSVGADHAYLVSDRAFGGSDTLATSYILSCAIAEIEKREGKFDVLFCGKQAIDGDTAQVGPELAEHMDIPQATYAVGVKEVDGKIHVKQETDSGYNILEMSTPCMVTVTKTPYELRYPSIKSKLKANKAEIPTITAADLEGIDLTQAGLKGSPTKVKRTFTPTPKGTGVVIEDEDLDAAVAKLIELLDEAKII
jgi:electron transfer flavoprotein alpha/beta subunit